MSFVCDWLDLGKSKGALIKGWKLGWLQVGNGAGVGIELGRG